MDKITRSLMDIVNKIKRQSNFTSFDFIHNVHQASGYLIHHYVVLPKKYIQS